MWAWSSGPDQLSWKIEPLGAQVTIVNIPQRGEDYVTTPKFIHCPIVIRVCIRAFVAKYVQGIDVGHVRHRSIDVLLRIRNRREIRIDESHRKVRAAPSAPRGRIEDVLRANGCAAID